LIDYLHFVRMVTSHQHKDAFNIKHSLILLYEDYETRSWRQTLARAEAVLALYRTCISTLSSRDCPGSIDPSFTNMTPQILQKWTVDLIGGIGMMQPPPPATQDGQSRLSARMRSAEIAQEIDIDVPTFYFEKHTVDHCLRKSILCWRTYEAAKTAYQKYRNRIKLKLRVARTTVEHLIHYQPS
jgi:hypothetical protein